MGPFEARSQLLYRLASAEVPWGDYGDVLVNGIAWNLPRVDGVIQLERTGQGLRPLTFPWGSNAVVTSVARAAIESSELIGFAFLPVIKARIVDLDWTSWPDDIKPAVYPAGGEPDRYVLGRKHNVALSDALGELYELTATTSAPRVPGSSCLAAEDVSTDFLVGNDGSAGVFVSDTAKRWFEDTMPGACTFERCR